MKSLRWVLVGAALLFASPAFAAVEISTASGNVDSSGTWSLIEPNTFLNSETANTALTTSFTGTNTLTPGAVTVQGIGVKLASVAASPTGTLSCRLVVTSGLVLVDSVTVNVSDLVTAAAATSEGGWIVLEFGSTHLLTGATPYEVQCETSSSAQVNLFSSGTTVWSQMLITTTAQAPAAGDSFYVFGQLTGAGTHNAFVVTNETTANTNYGNVANTLVSPSISIGQFGTLAFAHAASTAYLMEFAGPLVGYNGGTFTVGTLANPIPANSTAVLTENCTVEGDTGATYRNGFTFNAAGVARTAATSSLVQTHLNLNIAAGAQTTLTVTDSTGWLSSDAVVLAATDLTTGTVSHSEKLTLTGPATSTTLPFSATLSFAHLGQTVSYASSNNGAAYSLPEQAEIILLTRNVVIQGSGNTTPGYIYCTGSSSCVMDWVEFNEISGKAAGQYGLESDTTSAGTFSLTHFSFHDAIHAGIILAGSSTSWGGTAATPALVQNGVFYNVCTVNLSNPENNALDINAATTNTNWVLDKLTFLSTGANCTEVKLNSVAGQFTNIVMADNFGGGSTAFQVITPATGVKALGNWGPITFHSNSSGGADGQWQGNGVSGTINGHYTYHSAGSFISATNNHLVINNLYTLQGNNWGGFGSTGATDLTINNGFIGFDSAARPSILLDENFNVIELDNEELCPTQTVSITQSTGTTTGNSLFVACSASNVTSITPVNDVGNNASNFTTLRLTARNSPFLAAADTTLPGLLGQNFMTSDSYVTTDWGTNHKAFLTYGIITYDTAIFHTSAYSTRLTPQIVQFTASIAGTLMTVTGTAYPAKSITTSLPINGAGVTAGTLIQSLGTGTGGSGTYNLNNSQTVSSETMTGNTGRLPSAPIYQGVKVALKSGTTAQVCVWVRLSDSGDASGISYNGDAPRLIERANPYLGVNTDQVLATFSGSTTATWQQLCGTSNMAAADGEFEFVVDADMTATSNAGGWVNVADWSASGGAINPNGSQQFWFNGVPFDTVTPAGGAGGGTVIGGNAAGGGIHIPVGP